MNKLAGKGNIILSEVQYFDQLHDRRLEIIGNIYENPALLETKE